MQLPKKPHSPQSYKKKPISKESQQVNGSTGQREIEFSNFRDFESRGGYRLNFSNFLTP